MQTRFKVSFSATAMHAACCVWRGIPAADAALGSAVGPAAEELLLELEACGFDAAKFLPVLAALSAEYDNNRQLAEAAQRRVVGTGGVNADATARLAGRVADIEAALTRYRPEMVEELAVRGRPLRDEWETRGPGMLRRARQLTGDALVAPSAEVVLVAPFAGGHGTAAMAANRVLFEAVLANPHADLPEVVRLAWLLLQLNFDLPMFSETIGPHAVEFAAKLASVPIALESAATVDLATCDEPTIARALECWHLAGGLPPDAASRLQRWWQAYVDSQTPLPVALAALPALFDDAAAG